PLARYAGGTQRNLVGLRHGSTVARTAAAISVVPDLPPAFPTVGPGRQTGTHFTRPGRGVARPRKIGWCLSLKFMASAFLRMHQTPRQTRGLLQQPRR